MSAEGGTLRQARLPNVAVVLCSSDNTADVARQVVPSFARHWPDCPYPRFVVFSTAAARFDCAGWRRVDADSAAGWREELRNGLDRLGDQYEYLLLFLDDFLLVDHVESARLQRLVAQAQQVGADYLRLVPMQRSIWMRYLRRGSRMIRIPDDEPYYSSLQLALWRRSHLLEMLRQPGSIWDFEHQRTPAGAHFAICEAPPCRYLHVVEKGRWMPYAPKLFAAARLPFVAGGRPLLGATYHGRHVLGKLRFALTGYGPMRARRFLARHFGSK